MEFGIDAREIPADVFVNDPIDFFHLSASNDGVTVTVESRHFDAAGNRLVMARATAQNPGAAIDAAFANIPDDYAGTLRTYVSVQFDRMLRSVGYGIRVTATSRAPFNEKFTALCFGNVGRNVPPGHLSDDEIDRALTEMHNA